MPLPVIASVVRFAVTGTGGSGQPWANVIHMQHSGGAPSAANISAAMDELIKPYRPTATLTASTGWLSLMKNTAATQKITATVLDGVTASVTNAYSYLGTSVADSLPPEVAVVVSVHTARRGRSYRGRIYLPAPTEGLSDSVGHFDAGQATTQAAIWNALATALAGINWVPVVASYLHATAEPVTTFAIDTVFDAQRRRKV